MCILDRKCMHFDGANKKDEQKFCPSLQPVSYSFFMLLGLKPRVMPDQ